jgi:hypothetical protein
MRRKALEELKTHGDSTMEMERLIIIVAGMVTLLAGEKEIRFK